MSARRKRKGNRLKEYDYSGAGYYFVTICTQNRIDYFGQIQDDKINLNEIGEIVHSQWLWLAMKYTYINLDEYVVMPNHFHGIIAIQCRDRSRPVPTAPKIKSLSELIGAFKTTSSKRIHRQGVADFKWQRSFYDRIIRSDKELTHVREYIQNNPLNWGLDKENLNNWVER